MSSTSAVSESQFEFPTDVYPGTEVPRSGKSRDASTHTGAGHTIIHAVLDVTRSTWTNKNNETILAAGTTDMSMRETAQSTQLTAHVHTSTWGMYPMYPGCKGVHNEGPDMNHVYNL